MMPVSSAEVLLTNLDERDPRCCIISEYCVIILGSSLDKERRHEQSEDVMTMATTYGTHGNSATTSQQAIALLPHPFNSEERTSHLRKS